MNADNFISYRLPRIKGFESPHKNQPASGLRTPAGVLMMWKIVILAPSSSYLRLVGARRAMNAAEGEERVCGQVSRGGRE